MKSLAASWFLLYLNSLYVVKCDHEGSSDPLDWLRESVSGEPGVDYPIYAEIQDTSFSCSGRVFGGKRILFFFKMENLVFFILLQVIMLTQKWNARVIMFACHLLEEGQIKKYLFFVQMELCLTNNILFVIGGKFISVNRAIIINLN